MELIEQNVRCPYCGETYISLIDLSYGTSDYVEDCEVCCQPIQFQLRCSGDQEAADLNLSRDDD